MHSVYVVAAGSAKTIRHSAVGKLVILQVAGPGDVLDGLGVSLGRYAFGYCPSARTMSGAELGCQICSNLSRTASLPCSATRSDSWSAVCEW